MIVIINSATSIDGKIATRNGESKISSHQDLQKLHRLRCHVDGVIVGISTVLKDDPLLTIRFAKCSNKKNPARIIIDTRARIPLKSRIVKTASKVETIVVVSKEASREKIMKLIHKGIKIIIVERKGNRVDLKRTFKILETEMGFKKILVEGGGEINWSVIKNNLFDELRVTVSPLIIGGKKAITLVEGKGFGKINECSKLKLLTVNKTADGEIQIRYKNSNKIQ
ncbi:MAG: 2,5-diamino-6-(ribosylamino)-4(3H)-pyrimidinone 5'-phosphate reductase [Thermoproteota archaeon]|nr:2,5-diamino-6-(ribosylamino)-4(3H)-pyrimidinone 5'-phosphate reductase [Thermoproteota archaeon]